MDERSPFEREIKEKRKRREEEKERRRRGRKEKREKRRESKVDVSTFEKCGKERARVNFLFLLSSFSCTFYLFSHLSLVFFFLLNGLQTLGTRSEAGKEKRRVDRRTRKKERKGKDPHFFSKDPLHLKFRKDMIKKEIKRQNIG